MNKTLKKILEDTGIDVIPHAIGLAKFATNSPSIPQKLKDIQEKLKNLSSKNAQNALTYSKEVLEKENERGEKIEAKAYSLIGVIGISTAFITGITGLLPEKATSIILISTLYILIVLSLTLTVLLASRVVIVGEYKYSYPDMADILSMGNKKNLEIQKEQIADNLYCYSKNSQIINIKASYLMGSQKWFRNGIILFLLLAIVLVTNIPNSVDINSARTATQTLTQSMTNPTSTSTPMISTNTANAQNFVEFTVSITPTELSEGVRYCV